MITVRRSEDRGLANFGWLESRHTFSFGDYHDAKFMGFGPLRVINEDRVEPGRGFDRHSHQNMEILSWVLEGSLQHKDSIGTGAVIVPGEMQRMTAGTGVAHSEFNNSNKESVHFLQIWIIPSQEGLKPSYEQRSFSDEINGKLSLVASGDGHDGSILIHQDVKVLVARARPDTKLVHMFNRSRLGWIQIARGRVALENKVLEQGDGVALADIQKIEMETLVDSEVLLFDMTAGNF